MRLPAHLIECGAAQRALIAQRGANVARRGSEAVAGVSGDLDACVAVANGSLRKRAAGDPMTLNAA